MIKVAVVTSSGINPEVFKAWYIPPEPLLLLVLTYHWLSAASNCTGWPKSPEILSDTLEKILRLVPPAISIAFPAIASVSDDAYLISLLPALIAK